MFAYVGAYDDGEFSRDKLEKFSRIVEPGVKPKHKVELVDIQVPALSMAKDDGKGIFVRIVKPLDVEEGKTVPIVAYFHGGGFCIGDPADEMYTSLGIEISKQFGNAYVVLPGYRLAPEFVFPAAILDSYDVIQWLATDESLKHIPASAERKKIVCMGESAGGNICVVISGLVKDNLDAKLSTAAESMSRVSIGFCISLNPACMPHFATKSAVENTEAMLIRYSSVKWFMDSYVPLSIRGTALEDRRVNLFKIPLQKFPRTTVVSSGRDPFTDENFVFVEKLKAANVNINHMHFPKGVHGGFLFAWEKERKKIFATLAAEVKDMLDSERTTPILLEEVEMASI
eukprot:CAMPEP_0203758924 /NCGR_PEP_ID=MMETSP0098-20131031/11823_1 /ASSEMBLY_ACC=CAM_ASM_000208 /TAXON_ID=96639 /ORGANISM=" , Strain NY0313808BC1" /LENGTH=342 /DNA_ID=CAMNT_0050651603 /DNA_START=433 /DNA_END=1461 /DNA_ORIENTATION=-